MGSVAAPSGRSELVVRQLGAGEDIAGALAEQRLGAGAVLFFVMSAAAPLTVVAGTLTTAYSVTGQTGLPVAFAIVGLVLGVFSVGYVAMGRYLPHAGAMYAYAAHGLGRWAGVGVAWTALVAYNLIQVSLSGAIGAAASPLVQDWVGISLPWWVYAVAMWAVVGVLGIARVDLNGRVLATLLLAEVTLIVVYDVVFATHPAAGMAWSTWSQQHLTRPGVGAILAIGVLGFVGFESAVVLSEEARDARRTVPTATHLAVALIAALYGVSAWAMTVAADPTQIVQAARDQGPDLVFTMAAAHLGHVGGTLGHILFATSIFAAALSFHNTIARYAFALGREHVLPQAFGRTSNTGAPRAASLAQSVIGLTVIVGYAVSGADPVVRLFYLASTSGALGVLLLLSATGVSVLGFFGANRRGEPLWRTRIAPILSLAGLTVMAALVLANFATLLGVPQSSPLRWGIPAAFALTGLAGASYGLVLRARRSDTYTAIGHGPRASLATTPTVLPPTPYALER
jgi:amino acid transporter